jgi:hypothetical protein
MSFRYAFIINVKEQYSVETHALYSTNYVSVGTPRIRLCYECKSVYPTGTMEAAHVF